MTTSMPAFVRGAKKLYLLKLDGELSFGIHEQQHRDAHGHKIFLVRNVDRLSPSARAGIARGDQLLNVKVLGVDTLAYVWSDAALEHIENFHEICIVEICVKKRDGASISDSQLRHRDHISHWLTKAKTLSVSSKRFRGAFIPSQLKRVVALLYDYELDYFATLWKALPDEDRAGIMLPVARAFVSETKLPALAEERPPRAVASLPSTPMPTPPPSPAHTDADATISVTDSTSDLGHTEGQDARSPPVGAVGSDLEEEHEPSPLAGVPRRRARKLMTGRTASERRRQRAQLADPHGRDDDDTSDVVFVKVEPANEPAVASSSETPPTLAE